MLTHLLKILDDKYYLEIFTKNLKIKKNLHLFRL